jgi:8-oxo-dGTP pyrophosphatase MutT (NUDIX family)
MQEYVVINASPLGVKDNGDAKLLVLKNRPEWQAGRLNLIGGKVEPGETHEDAARRELLEETGLTPFYMSDILLMGTIQCPDAVIYCYNTWVDETQPLKPQEGETEKVAWFQWYEVLHDTRLMPNLRVVLPLMDTGVQNWTLHATTNSLDHEFHSVELVLPSSMNPNHYPMKGVNAVIEGKDIIKRPPPPPAPKKRSFWSQWF